MSRLIDEKTAIQRFIQETKDSGKDVIHINTIKRLLQDVDTAYNVEKVVEALEENAFDYYLCDGVFFGFLVIKILKIATQ